MADLEAAEIRHWSKLPKTAAIYSRDGNNQNVNVVPRRPKSTQRDNQEFITVVVDKSFMVSVEELLSIGFYPPRKYDKITYVNGSGNSVTYEVMSDGDENVFGEAGNYGVMININAKRVKP